MECIKERYLLLDFQKISEMFISVMNSFVAKFGLEHP